MSQMAGLWSIERHTGLGKHAVSGLLPRRLQLESPHATLCVFLPTCLIYEPGQPIESLD